MKEKDFERIEEMMQRKLDQQTETFQGYPGVMSEDIQHKLDIVVEGHQMLSEKIDRQGEQLSAKIDAVANDLAEHRRDTEAHKSGYKAMDE